MKAVSNALFLLIVFFLVFIFKQLIIFQTQGDGYAGFLKMWLLAPLFSIAIFVPNIRGNAVKIKASGKGVLSVLEITVWIFSSGAVLFYYGIVESLTLQILVIRSVCTEDLNVAGKIFAVKLVDFTFLVFWITTFLVIYFLPEFFELFIMGCYFITIWFVIVYGLIRNFEFVIYPNSHSLIYALASAFVPLCAFIFSELVDTKNLGEFLSLYLIANTIVTTFSLVFNRFIFSHNSAIVIPKDYYRRLMKLVLIAFVSLPILVHFDIAKLPFLIVVFLVARTSYTFIEGLYFNGHLSVGDLQFKLTVICKYFCALLLFLTLDVKVESFFVLVAFPQLLFVLALLVVQSSKQIDA